MGHKDSYNNTKNCVVPHSLSLFFYQGKAVSLNKALDKAGKPSSNNFKNIWWAHKAPDRHYGAPHTVRMSSLCFTDNTPVPTAKRIASRAPFFICLCWRCSSVEYHAEGTLNFRRMFVWVWALSSLLCYFWGFARANVLLWLPCYVDNDKKSLAKLQLILVSSSVHAIFRCVWENRRKYKLELSTYGCVSYTNVPFIQPIFRPEGSYTPENMVMVKVWKSG